MNLGLGASVSESQIVAAVKRFINDEPARMALSKNARSLFNSELGKSLAVRVKQVLWALIRPIHIKLVTGSNS